jgi:hypothetical protein
VYAGWRLNAIKVDNKNLKAVATVALIVLFAWVSPGIFASSTGTVSLCCAINASVKLNSLHRCTIW